MDNTTATNGTNTMYGLTVTPTLTHAADAGAAYVYGARIDAQGSTNGSSLITGTRISAQGGDFNYGLQLDVEDGANNVDLRIQSSADSGDYFQIQTTTAGATTITTVDDDGTAANLTFTVDGNITLDPAGGNVTVDGIMSASAGVSGSSFVTDGHVFAGTRVGIGTTVPTVELDVRGDAVIRSTSGTDIPQLIIWSEDTSINDGAQLDFRKYGDASLPNGENLGEIRFAGSEDNTSFGYAAMILGEADDASWADGASQGGRISFHTVTSGSTTLTERMMLRGDGKLGIGTSSPTHLLDVAGAVSASGGISGSAFVTEGHVFAGTRVGIGLAAGVEPSGSLHIKSGSVNRSPDWTARTLVLEQGSDGYPGMTLMGTNAGSSRIYLSSPAVGQHAEWISGYDLGYTLFGTSVAGHSLYLRSGNGTPALLLDGNQNVTCSNGNLIIPTTGKLSIGLSDGVEPSASLHVKGNTQIDGNCVVDGTLMVTGTAPNLRWYDSDTRDGQGVVSYQDYYYTNAGGALTRAAWIGFGSTGNEAYSFRNETTTGSFEFYNAGVTSLTIDKDHNVSASVKITAPTADIPGAVLGYFVGASGNNDQIQQTTTSQTPTYAVSGSSKSFVTFTAPPGGNVLLTAQIVVDVNSGDYAVMALSTNGSSWSTYSDPLDGTSVYESKQIICLADESDIQQHVVEWTLTGLTPGTSYSFYLGLAIYNVGDSATFRWSGAYPPLIMKAIALPENIGTY
tara:strand:- start:1792 stop:4002 length:2211 start_codon:yes stop_codon:yes gene_type:complete